MEHDSWELEIDGQWLTVNGGVSGDRRHLPLAAGQTQRNVEVWPWLWENMTKALEKLPPGKHTLRVARLLNGEGRSPNDPPQIRIVSQSVALEVVAEKVDPLPSLAGTTVSGGRVNAAAAVSATSIHVDPSIDHGVKR